MDADAYEAGIVEAYESELRKKDDEIERLLTKHEKEKNLLLTVLDKQTTEIERLKAGLLPPEAAK